MIKTILITISLFLSVAFCNAKDSKKYVATGKSSWYSVSCNGGTTTASGQKLSNNANTAAHKTLPFGTKIKVTNLSNGKSEICQVSDRGPFVRGRILDVTVGVAEKLGFKKNGIATVKIEEI